MTATKHPRAFLRLFVSLVIWALLLCFSVFAQAESVIISGDCGDEDSSVTYQLTDDGTLTISGTGGMAAYFTDSTCPWSSYRDVITSVVIEQGVTNVGYSAFIKCENLVSVSLPESVTAIKGSAFQRCTSLTEITMPSTLTSIAYGAFSSCTSLESIVIPEGITMLWGTTFSGCTSLVSVSLPNSLTTINTSAFERCTGLKSIVIPPNVTTIAGAAFYDCTSLTSVTLPDGLESLIGSAFQNCKSLKKIVIPEGITSIDSSTFRGCSALTSVTLRGEITGIGDNAFRGCSKLASITLPASVATIGIGAFRNCSALTSISLPAGLTSIGQDAFSGCSKLTSIVIPDAITKIGEGTFAGCWRMTSLTLPKNLTSIGEGAFNGCSALTDLLLPDKLTTIGESAFSGCSDLDTVLIPDSVKEIGTYAFHECGNPNVFFLGSDMPTMGIKVFYNYFTDETPIICCSASSKAETWAQENGLRTVCLDELTFPLAMRIAESGRIPVGQSISLAKTLYPLDDSAALTWSSSNPDVASIENDTLTALSSGTAVITASSGSRSDSIAVTVHIQIESFSLSPQRLFVGESAQITAEDIQPADAQPVFSYASSDSSILTVSDSGLAQAVAPGTATITVIADGVKNTCTVQVFAPVSAVAFDRTELSIAVGGTTQLIASVTSGEQTLTNELVAFSSSNPSVASVDASGVVSAHAVGSAQISAVHGSFSASCSVTVRDPLATVLPSFLETIEEEAFAGSSVEAVILPSGCQSIGARAFADNMNLLLIHMPDSVTSIAEDAFENSAHVAFLCESENAAAAFAAAHGIVYQLR